MKAIRNVLAVLALLLVINQEVFAFYEHTEDAVRTARFAACVVKIIEENYLPKTSTINMISTTKASSSLLNKVFRETSRMEKVLVVLESSRNIRSKVTRNWNIFLIDSVESFKEIYQKILTKLFEFHGFYTIVLTDRRIDEIDEIFELLWKIEIHNVVVIFADDGLQVKALTFNPFHPESCFKVKSMEIFNFSNLFYNKLKNLNRCTLKVDAPDWAPFSFLRNNEALGRDVDLIGTLSETLNFSLDLTILTELASWGMIFDNGTATGAIKNLLESRTDIIIGDYYLRPIRLKYMDASVEYFNADIVFVVPPGRNLESIEKLLQPFSRTVWILLGVSLLVAFIFVSLINVRKNRVFGSRISATSLILSILFAVSLPRQPKRSFARLLLMAFVIFCLVNQAVYQGLLYKFLQTDSKINEVQSIDEMIEGDFTFYSYDSMFEMIQFEKRIIERLIVMPYKDFSPILKSLRSSSMKGTMVSGLNEIIIINQQKQYNFTFKFCKERVMGIPIVMYFRKNFFLIPAINDVIGNLVSAGMIEHWHYKYIDERLLKQKVSSSDGPKVLTLDHLIGCFQLLAFGSSIAIVCFFLELCCNFVQRKKKVNHVQFEFVN